MLLLSADEYFILSELDGQFNYKDEEIDNQGLTACSLSCSD